MCVESNNFSLLNVRQAWQQLRYDRKGKVTRKHLSGISIMLMLTVLLPSSSPHHRPLLGNVKQLFPGWGTEACHW